MGRRIFAPKGRDTRPTSDRVREAAFNLIGPVDDAAVLDLFAGSGAMGLEALSRGAASGRLRRERPRRLPGDRPQHREAARHRRARRRSRTSSGLSRWTARTYDLILCDPPYGYPQHDRLAPVPRRARSRPTACSCTRPGSREEPAIEGLSTRTSRTLRLRTPYAVRALITAIYPGTYDPVTLGHVDVIRRAAAIFDRVVVGVVREPHPQEPDASRSTSASASSARRSPTSRTSRSTSSRELVVDFARRWEAKAIVKGLRVISDFEWEFQMNQLNRHLAPEIETVYVMASPLYSFISSSGVKEIATFGGNVDELVPPAVAKRFKELFPEGRGGAPTSPQE